MINIQDPVVLIALSVTISIFVAGLANIFVTRRYAGLVSNKLGSAKKLQQQLDRLERNVDDLVNEIGEITGVIENFGVPATNLLQSSVEEMILKQTSIEEMIEKIHSSLSNSISDVNVTVSEQITDTQNKIVKNIESKLADNVSANSYNIDKLYSRVESFHRLQGGFNDDTSQYGSLSGWAVYSDSLQLFIEKIGDRETILELGSGVSTFYLAKLIKDRGFGTLISVEHDLDFYNSLKQKLVNLKLDKYCTLLHCPLIDHALDDEVYPWYDIKNVAVLSQRKIDVMFVDGPPGHLRECSRYPALPIMKEFLSNDSLIFLDDAKRSDERKIAEKWIKDYKLEAEMTDNSKGLMTLQFSSNQGS
jgi:hypothetical protein